MPLASASILKLKGGGVEALMLSAEDLLDVVGGGDVWGMRRYEGKRLS